MSEKHRKIVLAAAIVIFILLIAAVGWFVGVPMVRLADDPEAFRVWIEGFGSWGYLIFIGMVALQVIISIVPGGPFELAAGYAYGTLKGTLLCMAGFLVGSWLVFSLVRRYGMRVVELFFSREKLDELKFLKNPKKTRVLGFVLMVIPGSPKDMLNYFAGLTQIKRWEWLLIVMVGRIPALVGTVISGAAAGEEKYILSVAVMAGTAIVSGIGVLYYRYLCKRENEENKPTA